MQSVVSGAKRSAAQCSTASARDTCATAAQRTHMHMCRAQACRLCLEPRPVVASSVPTAWRFLLVFRPHLAVLCVLARCDGPSRFPCGTCAVACSFGCLSLGRGQRGLCFLDGRRDRGGAGHIAGALSRTDVEARARPLRVCRTWQSLLRTSLVSAKKYRKMYSVQFAVRQQTHVRGPVHGNPFEEFHAVSSCEWSQILKSILVGFPGAVLSRAPLNAEANQVP